MHVHSHRASGILHGEVYVPSLLRLSLHGPTKHAPFLVPPVSTIQMSRVEKCPWKFPMFVKWGASELYSKEMTSVSGSKIRSFALPLIVGEVVCFLNEKIPLLYAKVLLYTATLAHRIFALRRFESTVAIYRDAFTDPVFMPFYLFLLQ